MFKITPPEFYSRILPSENFRKITKNQYLNRLTLFLIVFVLSSGGLPEWKNFSGKNFKSWSWEAVKQNQVVLPPSPGAPPDLSHWSARAGLQAIYLNEAFYIFGGRTPIPGPPGNSIIHGDVWKSTDLGKTWSILLPSNEFLSEFAPKHWASRAYFQSVKKENYMYVLGGQNFKLVEKDNPLYPFCPPIPGCDGEPLPCEPTILESDSDFFNDVWRSEDGINWVQMTDPAASENRWQGRAGLSAVVFKGEIYVMGGSFNDDPAVIGGPPTRVYFNDVWKSGDDGATWSLVTDKAQWAPRAGGVVVVKDDYIYMIGGEEGFTCPQDPNLPPTQQPPCLDPPYFNDVWRTEDGENWELVTDNTAWTKRPGHQVVVAQDRLVLFGGFGLGPDNGISPSNPSDVWISNKGKVWKKVSDAPWNAEGSDQIKYDFDALVVKGSGGESDAIYTFGGDRETFNFCDAENFKNVDNDVWKFSLVKDKKPDLGQGQSPASKHIEALSNFPNPFNESTTINYFVSHEGFVQLKIFDRHGRLIKTMVMEKQVEGSYEVHWDGTNRNGKKAPPGLYYAKLISPNSSKVIKILLTK